VAFDPLQAPQNLSTCNEMSCTEGSNVFLSATQSEVQRKPCSTNAQIREVRPFFAIIGEETGLQRTDCRRLLSQPIPVFLRSPDQQSDLPKSLRRITGGQMPNARRSELMSSTSWANDKR
jgi:hypothetical protein